MLDANIKIISELKSFIFLVLSDHKLLEKFSTSPGSFTRTRKLPFDKLVLFITKLCKKTLSVELEQFFDDWGCEYNCSVSAFVQQRLKLEPFFFCWWNMLLVNSFLHYYGNEVKRWNGYRVVAADGSNVSLVNNASLSGHFGGQRNQKASFTQAKTFYHYDVLNELVLSARIEAYRYGEIQMAYDAMDAVEEDMLMIYDRYYCSYKMVALHLWQEQERKFVIRGNERQNLIKSFINSGKRSSIVLMQPSCESLKGLKKCGFIITNTTRLKVRLVRVELASSIEVLVTNLWEEDGFETDFFKDLYFMRWGVETNISIQKNILQMESFSGLTVQSVLQDFYATIVMVNLHSILIKTSQTTVDNTTKHHKHPKKINKNKSFGKLKARIISLFVSNNVVEILQKLTEHFIRDLVPIRKGRSFKRVRKSVQAKSKYKTFSNFKPAH